MIVVGTDFSEGAHDATRVAAALGRRLGRKVVLATAVGPVATHAVPDAALATVDVDAVEDQVAGLALERELARVTAPDVPMEARVLHGAPAQALEKLGREAECGLLVVGSHGHHALGRLLLGRVADRVALQADRPVLVVRGTADALVAWATGERTLRALVAVDFSRTGQRAVAAARALRELGPVDLVFTHVHAVPLAYERLPGAEGERLSVADRAAVEAARQELETRVGPLPGQGTVEFRVRPEYGRVAAALVHAAREVQPDLLVVATHGRRGVARLWYGSVARDLVHASDVSVLSVPPCAATEAARPELPCIATVLAVVEAGPHGADTVGHACALLRGRGGLVEACLVVPPDTGPDARAALVRHLHERLPESDELPGLRLRVHVVDDPRPAPAVARLIAQLGADVVVTGGVRPGRVPYETGRPVLIVPQQPE